MVLGGMCFKLSGFDWCSAFRYFFVGSLPFWLDLIDLPCACANLKFIPLAANTGKHKANEDVLDRLIRTAGQP